MRVRDVARRAGRSLRHAKIRTILTALAIGVGAFTLTLTIAASTGAKVFIDQVISDNFDPAELIVTKDEQVLGNGDTSKPREYDPNFGTSTSNAGAITQIKRLDQKDLEIIKKTPGVESIREGVSVNAAYVTREGQKKFVATLQAVSPAQKPELLAGTVTTSLSDSQILLPEGYLESLGFTSAEEALNKTVTVAVRKMVNPAELATQIAAGVTPEQLAALSKDSLVMKDFTIVSVLKKPVTAQPGTELYILTSEKTAQNLNEVTTQGTDDFQKYPSIYVKVTDGTDSEKLKAVQAKLKDLGYTTLSVEETQKFLLQFINVLQGIVAGFAFLAIVASVFGVINTQYISVLERTQQIGLMKALGMRRRDISRLFRFEAAWIGLLGGSLGAGVAFILGTALNPWITKKLELGSQDLLIFQATPILGLIVGLMLVAVFAGILPARKAGKLDPVEALRTE